MDKRQVGCDENRQGSAAGSPPNFVFSDSLRLKRVWWGVALASDTTFDLVGQPTSRCQLDLSCWQWQDGRQEEKWAVDTKLTKTMVLGRGCRLGDMFCGQLGLGILACHACQCPSVGLHTSPSREASSGGGLRK